jgi:hypothetical protein
MPICVEIPISIDQKPHIPQERRSGEAVRESGSRLGAAALASKIDRV